MNMRLLSKLEHILESNLRGSREDLQRKYEITRLNEEKHVNCLLKC